MDSPLSPRNKTWPICQSSSSMVSWLLLNFVKGLMLQLNFQLTLSLSLFILKNVFYVEILRRTVFHWGPLSPPPADMKHFCFFHWLHELWRLNVIVLILNGFLFLFEMNSWTHFVLMLWNTCSKITAFAFSVIPCWIPPFTLLLYYIAKT